MIIILILINPIGRTQYYKPVSSRTSLLSDPFRILAAGGSSDPGKAAKNTQSKGCVCFLFWKQYRQMMENISVDGKHRRTKLVYHCLQIPNIEHRLDVVWHKRRKVSQFCPTLLEMSHHNSKGCLPISNFEYQLNVISEGFWWKSEDQP